jgi:hypothetical protein
VKRASTAVLALLAWMLLVATSMAQINAAPPSVTSVGFGGRTFNGPAPSVTSVGPRGFAPNPAFPNSRVVGGGSPDVRPRRHDFPYWGAVYAVPYYGYYDAGNGDDAANDAESEEYKGGPTVFDRRGPGYVPRPPADDYADAQQAETAAALPDPSPATPQPETVLVFKDGHQLEVENYAIVGSTLYDLTEGHRRRIDLSDLDLTATAKQNDDRGIDFRVPAGSD